MYMFAEISLNCNLNADVVLQKLPSYFGALLIGHIMSIQQKVK